MTACWYTFALVAYIFTDHTLCYNKYINVRILVYIIILFQYMCDLGINIFLVLWLNPLISTRDHRNCLSIIISIRNHRNCLSMVAVLFWFLSRFSMAIIYLLEYYNYLFNSLIDPLLWIRVVFCTNENFNWEKKTQIDQIIKLKRMYLCACVHSKCICVHILNRSATIWLCRLSILSIVIIIWSKIYENIF